MSLLICTSEPQLINSSVQVRTQVLASQNKQRTSALDSLVHLRVYFELSGKENKVFPLRQSCLAEARLPHTHLFCCFSTDTDTTAKWRMVYGLSSSKAAGGNGWKIKMLIHSLYSLAKPGRFCNSLKPKWLPGSPNLHQKHS